MLINVNLKLFFSNPYGSEFFMQLIIFWFIRNLINLALTRMYRCINASLNFKIMFASRILLESRTEAEIVRFTSYCLKFISLVPTWMIIKSVRAETH